MGFISTIKGWLAMLLSRGKIKEVFGVNIEDADELDAFLSNCVNIYRGRPDWLDAEQHIKTVNFAESVCSEIARLATMNVGVSIAGSARADWLQEQVDRLIMPTIRQFTEYGAAYGTLIMKPNGTGIDILGHDRFRVVSTQNGTITGVVFLDRRHDTESDRWYTRMEYHRIDNEGVYTISNRYFVGASENDSGRPTAMETTPWVSDALADDLRVEGADRLLFGIFRTPSANNVDLSSPLGLPMFSSALEELRDLDVAYSRNSKEVYDSKRLVLIDSDRVFPAGAVGGTAAAKEAMVANAGLPDYVKAVEGTGSVEHEVYHEINPSLRTDERLRGINALLSQIGFKCGFSNGYFVFNEKTGMVTATQVESDDRRTIQLIADVRKALRECLDGAIYALDRIADGYGLAPRGSYEVAYDFADITMNEEEDKARWYGYVTAGRIPFWYYLVKFEGMTEEEAKELEAAAQGAEPPFAGAE